MKYNPSTGKYAYHQYGKVMTDQITGEVEEFNNVLILEGASYENYIYTEVNFHVGGTGYYACGGRIIPITWTCDNRTPFRLMTLDGEPLNVNVGNTYMSIIGFEKERVEWKEVIPPETEPPVTEPEETVPETTEETVAETTEETVSQTMETTAAETAAP